MGKKNLSMNPSNRGRIVSIGPPDPSCGFKVSFVNSVKMSRQYFSSVFFGFYGHSSVVTNCYDATGGKYNLDYQPKDQKTQS